MKLFHFYWALSFKSNHSQVYNSLKEHYYCKEDVPVPKKQNFPILQHAKAYLP